MPQANNSHITTPIPSFSLASLVQHYWEEVDGDPDLDDEGKVNATARLTMSKMVGVPAETAEDALAALDCLLAEGVDLGQDYDPINLSGGNGLCVTTTSLTHAIRDYLAGNAA